MSSLHPSLDPPHAAGVTGFESAPAQFPFGPDAVTLTLLVVVPVAFIYAAYKLVRAFAAYQRGVKQRDVQRRGTHQRQR